MELLTIHRGKVKKENNTEGEEKTWTRLGHPAERIFRKAMGGDSAVWTTVLKKR